MRLFDLPTSWESPNFLSNISCDRIFTYNVKTFEIGIIEYLLYRFTVYSIVKLQKITQLL